MRVKICGITNLDDAVLSVDTGAWAVGFIFVKNTPRYIIPEKALEIIANLPTNIEKVGVFVDSRIEEVAQITSLTGITKIQLHGDETPDNCLKLAEISGKEIIKAVSIKDVNDLKKINNYKGCASCILLDTYSESQKGGTGRTFDWRIAQQAKEYGIPIILAGGLNTDNIEVAYKETLPFALDLSSGLEESKGIKDKQKLETLKNIIKNNKANL